MKRVPVLVALLLLAGCAADPVEQLNGRLLANPSATATLEAWCAERRLAETPRIAARRGRADKPAPAEVRQALAAPPGEAIGYRQVQLVCGTRVLSEADNWYRPGVLTPEMNRLLETTDTPFGRAVAALNFTRRTLSVARLDPATGAVLEHRAVLSTGEGVPFSYVVERYTDQVTAVGPAP